jgi:hypothetical protein
MSRVAIFMSRVAIFMSRVAIFMSRVAIFMSRVAIFTRISKVIYPLLGFEHEAATFVEINPTGRPLTIAVVKYDGFFEYVSIARRVISDGVRRINPEQSR